MVVAVVVEVIPHHSIVVHLHYLAEVVVVLVAVLLVALKMVVMVVMQQLLAQAKQVVQVVLVTAHSGVLCDGPDTSPIKRSR
jgi:hypothetical protein